MTYKINNDKTAAVSLDTFWKPASGLGSYSRAPG